MALSRSEFEKKLVSSGLVGTRNRAYLVAGFIRSNLQGTSAEAFAALIPLLMKSGLAPSTSSAKSIVVIAMDWLGE